MQLELALQICVAATSTIGTLLMGVGERDAGRPLAALVVALVALYVVDYRKWFRFNPAVANIAGILAVVLSLREAVTVGYNIFIFREEWLLAVAHLLSYLQFVMLLQEKNTRIYWMLLTLSLLQVAVAAALSLEMWFGLLLLVYLALALVTMTLFFLYREQLKYDGAATTATFRPPRTNWVRPRWPLANRAAHFRSNIQYDPAYSGISGHFLRRIALMMTVTVGLTMLLFFLVPRSSYSSASVWSQPRGAAAMRSTGFTDEVNINDFGEMLENTEKIIQLRFEDFHTGQAVQLSGEPVLRGAVLNNYLNGKWVKSNFRPAQRRFLEHLPQGNNLLRQTIDLEPMDSNVLFTCMPYAGQFPLVLNTPREDIFMDTSNATLERSDSKKKRKFHYELYVWGLENNRLPDRFPQTLVAGDPITLITQLQPTALHSNYFNGLTNIPRENGLPALQHLQRIADRVAPGPSYTHPGETGTETDFDRLWPQEVEQRARLLESYLRDSGEFSYSLRTKPVDPKLDPVEDFLVNRKSGHCEYYATALTLMLRSKGIPARMISGFQGGEWNEIGEFYQIRQLHAHAWVEAYLPPDPTQFNGGGIWLRLDATPSEARNNFANQTTHPVLAKIYEINEYAQYLWSSYILGMDALRQKKSVYQPIKDAYTATVAWLFDREAWSSLFTPFWKMLVERDWSYFKGHWFNWRGGLVTIAFLWSLVGLTRLWRWGWRRWKKAEDTDTSHLAGAATQVAFYRQLEDLLARHDRQLTAAQTPREFAIQTGGRLADHPQHQLLAALPRRIAEAFYRVRFGGADLDKTEREAVENALQELTAGLEPPPQVASNGSPHSNTP